MKKLNENQLENLNGGVKDCAKAIVIGAAAGVFFGGVGSFVGALAGALSPDCLTLT